MWDIKMSLFIVKWKPTSSLSVFKLFRIGTKSQWWALSKIQGTNSSEHPEGKEKSESIHLTSQTAPFREDFHQTRQHKHNTKVYSQLYLEWVIFFAQPPVSWLLVYFGYKLFWADVFSICIHTLIQIYIYVLIFLRGLPAVLQFLLSL